MSCHSHKCCMCVQEVEAAKAMAPRGALLIGTAHGHSLSDILRNHVLNPLVGGVREVTLGDMEAKASNAGQKVCPSGHALKQWFCKVQQRGPVVNAAQPLQQQQLVHHQPATDWVRSDPPALHAAG